VDVGHGQRILLDTREMGYVGHLFRAFIFVNVRQQAFIRIDDSIDPHLPGPGDPPTAVVDFFQMNLFLIPHGRNSFSKDQK
jgi:hypothetical protein